MRRWVLVLLGVFAAAGWLGVDASAGASLRESEPAAGVELAEPPDRVRLVYPAPVEEWFLALTVLGPDGAVRSRAPVVDPGNPAAVSVEVTPAESGTYTVLYGALTEDSNVLGGRYVFAVGDTDPTGPATAAPVSGPPQALLVLARALLLTGPILVLGAIGLRIVALGPAWREGGVAPPRPVAEREAASARLADAARAGAPGWWTVVQVGLGGWILGAPLAVAGYLSALDAPVGDLGSFLSSTRSGAGLVVIFASALLALAVLVAFWRRHGPRPDAQPGWLAVPGVAAALALGAASWSGHASTGSDRVVGIGADTLHNWGAALWLGGLAALVAWLPRARASAPSGERTALSAAVVVRFSSIAIVAVSVLVVTGIYRALAELPSAADALDTAWGLALVIKLALFVILLGLGAYNRLILHPRLERAALGLAASERGSAATLVVTTGTELVLGAAVMIAAAFLVVLPVPT